MSNIMNKVLSYINDSGYRFKVNSWLGLHNNMSDEEYLRRLYEIEMKTELHLDPPQTFNEKLQWIKLYDRKSMYTDMVDKCEVKKMVSAIIGDEYIIPTLGVWDRFDQIDFCSLPPRFVIKCTHDSGGLIVCRNKDELDRSTARRKINKCLKRNFYYTGREWPYKDVKPRIIAEQYMEDESNKGDLTDYKIHCFNGEPKVIQVITDRFSKDGMINDHYDLSWNKLDIVRGHYSSGNKVIPRPKEMDEMLTLARKLSEGFPYLRTDFYIVNHQIYFGELTFFPASGFRPFIPEKWNRIWGDWIKLPTDNVAE